MAELTNQELEEYNRMNASIKEKKNVTDSVTDHLNVIMIIVLSVMQVVLSCLSNVDGNIQFVFPTTVWGWVLLVAPKVIISILGYMVWSNFLDKGKAEAFKTEEYKKAQEILTEIQGASNQNIINVINPTKWERDTRIKKGAKVVVMSALTLFITASLIVNFSIASLLGTIASIVMAIAWGIMIMANAKDIYSTNYLRYANLLKVQYEAKKASQTEEQTCSQ